MSHRLGPRLSGNTVLRGWKQIGAYMQMSERAVQPWAVKYGLPYMKVGRNVVTSVWLIDRWILASLDVDRQGRSAAGYAAGASGVPAPPREPRPPHWGPG